MPLASVRHDSAPLAIPADQAVFILDRGGCIMAVHAGETLFGAYRPRELIGKHYTQLYATERDSSLLNDALHADGAEPPAQLETWLTQAHEQQQRTRVAISIQALKGEDGSVLGFSMVVRDLHLYRRLQDRLRESERRLRLFTHSA